MSTKISIPQALAKAAEFEENEEFDKAYECLKYAYSADKTNPEVLQQLAMTAQLMHNTEDAINYWNELMMIQSENPISYSQLLDLYFHDNKYEYYMTRAKLKTLEGRLQQAVSDYKKAISNTSDDKEIINARYLLAQSLELIDKPMQAIDEYLRILDHEHNENVYGSLAAIYYNHDKDSAIDILKRALEDYPKNDMFKELLAKIYMETGNYEASLDYAISPLSKAKALLMQEKNDEAMEILKTCPDSEKKTPKYLTLMAEYYYNRDEFDKSMECISELEKLDGNNPLVFQMRALVYEKQGMDFEEHFNWGKYYIKKNSFDIALNEYLNAYNSNPKNVEIINELINLYSSMNDNIAAIEFTEKLANIDKTNVGALKRLAEFYAESGYDDRALEYLERLYEINPRDYDVLLALGKYYEGKKKMQTAKEYYEQFLKYAPSASLDREKIEKKLKNAAMDEDYEEEGFLDKIINFFTKK